MNIARRFFTDPITVIVLLMQLAILGFYTLIRPEAPGGQFVAGFALGLMFLVVTIGAQRAKRDEQDRTARS